MVLEMQKPKIIVEELEDSFGRFVVEPLERGWGYTMGNSMRRILLSSIPGVAITQIKIDKVKHEFSTIPGMKEDTMELILNLKSVVIRMHENGPISLYIDEKGAKTVTAGDIIAPSQVEILNPELKLATLNKDGVLKMEMIAEKGRGYVPVERSPREREVGGTIPLDAMFSPITRVAFKVTNCRVGQRTDYDRLTLDVYTNGSIKPDDALTMAAKVLIEHIALFSSLSTELEVKPFAEVEAGPMSAVLEMSIDELELPVRALNCLHREGIRTVGQLIERTEEDLLSMRNFGSRSIEQVNAKLAEIGLELKKGE